jgi:hypothetical protein
MYKYSTAKLLGLNFILNCIEITEVEGGVRLPHDSMIFAIIKGDSHKLERVQAQRRRIKYGYETSCN